MNNQELINLLNQQLSNYFVMYVKLHRYKWYIKGKALFDLQKRFQSMYDVFAIEIDKIAEHILKINGQPLATMIKYTKETSLVEASADNEIDEIINQLTKDLKQITAEISRISIKSKKEKHQKSTMKFLNDLQLQLECYIRDLQSYTID